MGIKRIVRRKILGRLIDEEAARFIGLRVLTRIRVRTFDEGKGIDGEPLPAYSPAYARLRARKGLQVAPPDYTRTGRLRRATRVRSVRRKFLVGSWRIRIGPTGNRLIAGTRLNRRGAGWLGETADERQKTRADLSRAIRMTRKRDGSR